jgi:hypothetical protein
MAKLPSQNPAAARLRKAAKAARDAEDRQSAAAAERLQRSAVERGNREQAREADIPQRAKGGVMKKATKAGKAMTKKSADTMGRAMKKYAKGGSVDGCATKGKTKTKMVKMAMGGMATTGKMPAPGGGKMPMSSGRAGMVRGGMQGGPTRMQLPGRGMKRGGKC